MESVPEWIVNPGARVARLAGGDVAVDALTVSAPARGRGVQSLVVEPEDPLHDPLVRLLLLREPLAGVPLAPAVHDRLVQAGVLVRASYAPASSAYHCAGDPAGAGSFAPVLAPEALNAEFLADGARWFRERMTGIRSPWWPGEPVEFDATALMAGLETARRGLEARRPVELEAVLPLAQVEATARYFAGRAADGALVVDPSRGRSEARDDRLAAFWSRELTPLAEGLVGAPLAPLQATYVALRAGARADAAVASEAVFAVLWCLAYDGVEVGLLPMSSPLPAGGVPTQPGAVVAWRPGDTTLDLFRVPPGRTLALLLLSWGAAS